MINFFNRESVPGSRNIIRPFTKRIGIFPISVRSGIIYPVVAMMKTVIVLHSPFSGCKFNFTRNNFYDFIKRFLIIQKQKILCYNSGNSNPVSSGPGAVKYSRDLFHGCPSNHRLSFFHQFIRQFISYNQHQIH